MRSGVLRLIENPVPTYARKYPSAQSRTALRDALAREGFVKADAPLSGIFPPGTDGSRVVQPFWSAAGSAIDRATVYPGGLLMHELFNSRMAENFERTYDVVYFGGRPQVDRDTVIAAAFYHDIMKTVVFQFNEDGSLTPNSRSQRRGAITASRAPRRSLAATTRASLRCCSARTPRRLWATVESGGVVPGFRTYRRSGSRRIRAAQKNDAPDTRWRRCRPSKRSSAI